MSAWTAVSMVVITIVTVGVVAAARLIADAARDLVDELARLRSLRAEAQGLAGELQVLAQRRARGDDLRR